MRYVSMWLKSVLAVCIVAFTVIPVSPNPLSKGCQCAIRKVMSESGRFPCPKDCGCTYEPVCGFNPCEEEHPNHMFRTFHNKCELENTICDGPGHLYYSVYKGTCVMDFQDDTSCLFQVV